MFVSGYSCVVCRARYAPGEHEYTCPKCGLEGILDVEYDYDAVKRVLNRDALAVNAERSHWRYLPLLPIPKGARLPRLQVGWTPIYEAPTLAREVGVAQMLVKDDGRNPTGSFKDRASSVGVTRAVALGRKEIAAASTGNAASSLSGFAADMGMAARIFVPKTAPEAKVAQLLIYGATVFLVDAPYDVAWELCQQAVASFGWYNRNCAVNPHLVEGKKTAGLEIAEQLAARLPDVVAMSVGDGCSIAGVHKGLVEMQKLGVIDRVPRLLGVQAAGAAPLYRAFQKSGESMEPVDAQTLADSIAVGSPRNWRKGLRAVRDSGGAYVTVTDEQILDAMPRLARHSGVFGEPTAVAALAGVYEARRQGLIDARESVLVVSTGNGLKDARGAMRAVKPPAPIAPTLEDVRRAVG
jgi:threonine synthase